MTLAQVAVDDKSHEITAVKTLTHDLGLKGRVVTVDALLTQHHVAKTIVAPGGNYVMTVKFSHKTLDTPHWKGRQDDGASDSTARGW
jgi:predicted transposase YbfD/YdcC